MNRRSFLSLTALGAFAALTAGCALLRAPAETVPVERVGVCSWSFQEPLAQVDVRMREMGVKGIQLSLTPFIAPDGRHGAAEGSAALALVKQRAAHHMLLGLIQRLVNERQAALVHRGKVLFCLFRSLRRVGRGAGRSSRAQGPIGPPLTRPPGPSCTAHTRAGA